MLKRARSSLIVIAVLSVLTFVVVAGTLISAQRQTEVVVASRSLEVGTRLSARDVERRSIHAKAVLPGAYSSVEDVLNQTLTVQRVAGDQITDEMVGTSALNVLAAALPDGERAIAVHVNRAQGMAGLLRPGDRVSVIAVADSQKLGGTFGFESAAAMPPLQGPMAKLTLSGLRVLFVPWEFRYQEITPTDDEGGFMAPVVTSRQGLENGVLILSAPVTPVTVTWSLAAVPISDTWPITATAGITGTNSTRQVGQARLMQKEPEPAMVISPVELLALLDDTDAEIHLILEPAEQKTTVHTIGVTLRSLLTRQQEAELGSRE